MFAFVKEMALPAQQIMQHGREKCGDCLWRGPAYRGNGVSTYLSARGLSPLSKAVPNLEPTSDSGSYLYLYLPKGSNAVPFWAVCKTP